MASCRDFLFVIFVCVLVSASFATVGNPCAGNRDCERGEICSENSYCIYAEEQPSGDAGGAPAGTPLDNGSAGADRFENGTGEEYTRQTFLPQSNGTGNASQPSGQQANTSSEVGASQNTSAGNVSGTRGNESASTQPPSKTAGAGIANNSDGEKPQTGALANVSGDAGSKKNGTEATAGATAASNTTEGQTASAGNGNSASASAMGILVPVIAIVLGGIVIGVAAFFAWRLLKK